MTVHEDAQAQHDELVALRHDLHGEPEIGLELPRTQEKVLAALDGLGLEITTGSGASSERCSRLRTNCTSRCTDPAGTVPVRTTRETP